jgi:hypothetical protein
LFRVGNPRRNLSERVGRINIFLDVQSFDLLDEVINVSLARLGVIFIRKHLPRTDKSRRGAVAEQGKGLPA